jgi:hypothetical protein
MRWVCDDPAVRVDTVTGFPMTVMGKMPLLCHSPAVTAVAFDFFRHAGVPTPAFLQTFDSEVQFIELANACLRDGKRLAYIYPPPRALENAPGLLNSLPLYKWLNDKKNLTSLVPPRYLAPRELLTVEHATRALTVFPGEAVFVKACHSGGSGGGTDVRYCPDSASRAEAVDWITSRSEGLSGVLVEQEIELRPCWCLNLSILDSGARYLGAATQLFSEPGMQSGSRIDSDDLPPSHAIEVARLVAERAGTLGYRGIVGFDIGVTSDDRVHVFDLNFRIVGSTPLVLLHESAVSRAGGRISESWYGQAKGHLGDILTRFRGLAESGRFVPWRLYDATEATEGHSLIAGMLVARTEGDINSLIAQMQAALGAGSPPT